MAHSTGEEGRGLFHRISSDEGVPGNIVPRRQGGAVFLRMPRDIGGWVGGGGVEDYKRKVLTYVEYRAVSGVFQNIDPPTPFHPASVSSPRTKGRGVHTTHSPGGEGVGGGQYFGRRQT